VDEIVTLIIGFVLLVPATLIYLVVAQSRLKERVRKLEAALNAKSSAMPPAAQSAAPAKPRYSPPPKANEKTPKADEKTPEKPGQIAAATANPWAQTTKSAAAETPKPAPETAADQPPARPAGQALPPKSPTPGADVFSRFLGWLTNNWFYAVAAVSLALAGLFLVQYGMENGLLPPAARVASALLFGVALIGAGEYIRRRFGDADGSSTAYLPAVFSGAGIVSLFGGIVSARLLYDLIGPEFALVGLVVTALISIVLGWFNGPILAAVGVLGSFVAPLSWVDRRIIPIGFMAISL